MGVANQKLFNQCLKDAYKLCNNYFSPEIDNLEDDKIGDLLFKVLLEYNLLREDELEDNVGRKVSSRAKKSKSEDVENFFVKWRKYVENIEDQDAFDQF